MMDPGFRYYLITDRKQCHPRRLAGVVEQACRHGIKAVQLREKDLGGKALFDLAGELREVTRKWETKLFINDRADIAAAVEADGVHCRETSISPRHVKQLGASLTVGASVHTLKAARQAEEDGADFLLFGPVFYTASKAAYGAPRGVIRLRKVAKAVDIPVYAVGGLEPERAEACQTAGAYGLAGISSIMSADSVGEKVTQWKSTLNEL